MKKIKAIIFDFGGVILNIDYHKVKKGFENLNILAEENLFTQKQQSKIFDLLETGEISEKKFYTLISDKYKKEKIKKIWNSMLLDLPKERLELLSSLKKNYKIFLLSNTNSIHIDFLKNRFNKIGWDKFINLFDQVYLSYKIGMRKPNLDIFKYLLTKECLVAEEVLFIDDSIQHINAAKKLGINCFLLEKEVDITTVFPDIIQ